MLATLWDIGGGAYCCPLQHPWGTSTDSSAGFPMCPKKIMTHFLFHDYNPEVGCNISFYVLDTQEALQRGLQGSLTAHLV